MVARPAFTVEINKGGSKTLAMHCQFPENIYAAEEHEEQQYGKKDF